MDVKKVRGAEVKSRWVLCTCNEETGSETRQSTDLETSRVSDFRLRSDSRAGCLISPASIMVESRALQHKADRRFMLNALKAKFVDDKAAEFRFCRGTIGADHSMHLA